MKQRLVEAFVRILLFDGELSLPNRRRKIRYAYARRHFAVLACKSLHDLYARRPVADNADFLTCHVQALKISCRVD